MSAIIKNHNSRLAVNCMVLLFLAPIQIHTHQAGRKMSLDHAVRKDGLLLPHDTANVGEGDGEISSIPSPSDLATHSLGEDANSGSTAQKCSPPQGVCSATASNDPVKEGIKDCNRASQVTGKVSRDVFEEPAPISIKVSRGNSRHRVNSGHPLLFSGEEGLHFQTWYECMRLLLFNLRTKFENAGSLLR